MGEVKDIEVEEEGRKEEEEGRRGRGEELLHHECQGAAGLNVPKYELGQHVEANLVIGDGLDDADGEGEGEGNEDGEEEGPPGQVGLPA